MVKRNESEAEPLSASDIRRIAGASLLDERTIRRALSGRPVKPVTAAKIAEARKALSAFSPAIPGGER